MVPARLARLRASNLPRSLLWGISLAGWALLLAELPDARGPLHDATFIMLLVAAAWANYLKIEVGPISVNQAFAFELLGVLILDPVRAAFLGVMAYLLGTGIPQRHAPWRNAVNGAIIGMSVLAMGKTYEGLGGYFRVVAGDDPRTAHLWLILLASLSHFAINSLLVYAIVLSRPNPPNTPAILRTMQWDLLAKFIFAPLAYYIFLAYGAATLPSLVPPVLFILFIWLLLKNTMELTQARSELDRSVATLQRLHDISKEVYSSLELTEVLGTALSHAAHLAGAQHGAIFLEDRYCNDCYLAHAFPANPRWREYLEGAEMDWMVLAVRCPSEALPPGVRTIPGGGYHFQPGDPLAQELGIRRMIAYPLIDNDRVVGALVLGLNEDREPQESHRQILAIISMEVTQAIANARLHDTLKREFDKRQEELALAEKIQKRILPNDLELPGVRVHTHFRPARSVGGDYFDLIPLAENRLAVVIGDISGKGVPAALTMMSVVNRLKVWTTGFRHPDRVLELLN
ncbi:MAG TPA: GAF domain-containing protein, partial [bacterium]|nr:GAF domain-containing protein [bacterium]